MTSITLRACQHIIAFTRNRTKGDPRDFLGTAFPRLTLIVKTVEDTCQMQLLASSY